ncbi:MAG TPA: cupin domain-containing protein [Pedobacter sp.]|jgi:quercetin dioxygenase-like cupin family protein
MKNFTTKTLLLALVLATISSTTAFAQSQHAHGSKKSASAKTKWVNVFAENLTDSGLVNKKMTLNEYTLAPGFVDTTSHRHGAEVFIYVLEGEFEYRLGKNESKIYKKGEVVHEPPYSLHTLAKNPSTTEPAKLLLMFLFTDGPGAPIYVREYRDKKK